jgi:uncharacterized protein (DUF302 family)
MRTLLIALLIAAGTIAAPVWALEAGDFPYPGMRVVATPHGFAALVKRLDAAIEANGMFAVTRASASVGAKRRGVDIPGNMVVGVYRNDFAVRMLAASIPAGIEAPLRFYLTANGDGTASLSYRAPSAVFAPYGSAELDAMAQELDTIFAAIAAAAARRN